jgi:DNA-3-methyladenine glycosylase
MKRRPTAKGNVKKLANGPSKLCMAMGLSKKYNGVDLCTAPFYIEDGFCVSEEDIVHATRIGVDYAEQWKHKPWRFYIKDNPFVSIKAK